MPRGAAASLCSLGHPNQFYGIPTGRRSPTYPLHAITLSNLSDLRLECSHREGLYHSPSRFCLHFHLLAERHPDSCFGRWLHSGLDSAKAWNCEDTCLFHLCGGKSCQAFKERRACLCLHLVLLSKCLDHSTF